MDERQKNEHRKLTEAGVFPSDELYKAYKDSDLSTKFKKQATMEAKEITLKIKNDLADRPFVILTNSRGDTFRSENEELLDFLHGLETSKATVQRDKAVRETLIKFKTWEVDNDIKNLLPEQLVDFYLEANSPNKDYEAEKDAFIKMNHESLANSPDKEEKTNKAKKFDKSRCFDCGKIWAWNGDNCPMCGSGNIADIIIDRDR